MAKLTIEITDTHLAALQKKLADAATDGAPPPTVEAWALQLLRDLATQGDIGAYVQDRRRELEAEMHKQFAADIDARRADLEAQL